MHAQRVSAFLQQLPYGLLEKRVHFIGRNVREAGKCKAAVLQFRMRNAQVFRIYYYIIKQ